MDLMEFTPMDMAAADGHEVYSPKGVCAKKIIYAVEDGKLKHIEFDGGCDGNLKALSMLLVDMDVDTVVEKLSGITCGKKNTSCVDQLCTALKEQA